MQSYTGNPMQNIGIKQQQFLTKPENPVKFHIIYEQDYDSTIEYWPNIEH